jgi:hypothetical protein
MRTPAKLRDLMRIQDRCQHPLEECHESYF